ncbi:hypothetical protein T484DRAFT_1849926 [Baffinella frigidus]|nr:hypothetical protein T484DRAFT_1849926 [Cryptophyta sp. CCMP2293]
MEKKRCCAYFMFFREKGADSGTEMQGRDGIKPRTDEEAALPQETQETGQDTGNNVPQETQETNGQNVFCSQCGKTVGKDKRFCGGCGAPVAD